MLSYSSDFHLTFPLLSPDWSWRVRLLDSYFLYFSLYLGARLTLGGGIGRLSGEHGLAIDNLIKVVFLLNYVISD
jgi:hypothetical protein